MQAGMEHMGMGATNVYRGPEGVREKGRIRERQGMKTGHVCTGLWPRLLVGKGVWVEDEVIGLVRVQG